jgi:hypothetical protein
MAAIVAVTGRSNAQPAHSGNSQCLPTFLIAVIRKTRRRSDFSADFPLAKV